MTMPFQPTAASALSGERSAGLMLRTAYLCSIGVIFLIAHLSYYVQYPGLLSTFGVEPAATRVLPHSFPKLQQTLSSYNVDADSFIEATCLVGIVISSVVASGLVQHGLLYIILTAIYYFLTVTGGSFYTFQWDILLTEAGAVTALCCAPWLRLKLFAHDRTNSTIGTWAVRFLLFKLMFMSGVVKIQANCPTWLNLTALEYHFSTQCLPGLLAWHAHQLHPFFLRASVAATFVIEIPATFLLIAPVHSFRIIGVWMQILLQFVIILTGNYTFFNLLTIALCLPCFERDYFATTKKGVNMQERYSGIGFLLSKKAQYATGLGFLLWATEDMCQFQSVGGRWNVRLTWNKADTDSYVNKTIPWAIPAVFFFASISCARHIIGTFRGMGSQSNKTLRTVYFSLQLLTCSFSIGILSIPMLDLTPRLGTSGYVGSRVFSPLWLHARRYHLSSGYGLFRRMTGVGRASGKGWAGLAEPSVVARPEIIVEAQFQDDAGNSTVPTWEELNFRWKPGNINQRPLQVAPHQPRLDWRMWFAALGSYNHNPWFISLIDRLLRGCPDAINLLDEPDIAAGRKRISRIRSKLFVYDFTRVPSAWSKSIPGAALLKDGKVQSTKNEEVEQLSRIAWWKDMIGLPHQCWTRSFVKEYSPPIEANNPSVQQFLSSSGYSSKCAGRFYNERCESLPKDNSAALCRFTVDIRERNLVWAPVCLAVLVLIWRFATYAREGGGCGRYCVTTNDARKDKKKQQ